MRSFMKMSSDICVLLVFMFVCAEGLEQNVTCPSVTSKQIDITALDGIWYVAEAATDIEIKGNCTEIVFTHQSSNSTVLSLRWINNNSTKQYNGTAIVNTAPLEGGDNLKVVFADKRTIDYSILTITYDHFALLYSCKNNSDNNTSSYELWKLSRSPRLKEKHAAEMDKLIANYNITFGMLTDYSNSEQSCFKNGSVRIENHLAVIALLVLVFKIYL